MPQLIARLRVPQLRVLQVLSQGGAMSRQRICQLVGFSDTSGTMSYMLHGKKVSKANPIPFPGLLELGMLCRDELDIDGVSEIVYRITKKGREALAEQGGELPELRDKSLCTNRRYS